MDLEEPIRVQVTSVKYGKPGQFGESGCGLAWLAPRAAHGWLLWQALSPGRNQQALVLPLEMATWKWWVIARVLVPVLALEPAEPCGTSS